MKWITLLDQDRINLRLDASDNSLLLEVNDGGISPDYVTVRLSREEVEMLEAAIRRYKEQTA